MFKYSNFIKYLFRLEICIYVVYNSILYFCWKNSVILRFCDELMRKKYLREGQFLFIGLHIEILFLCAWFINTKFFHIYKF